MNILKGKKRCIFIHKYCHVARNLLISRLLNLQKYETAVLEDFKDFPLSNVTE